jgi:C4-dicarboxylate-specific signal transduction histidine kinase
MVFELGMTVIKKVEVSPAMGQCPFMAKQRMSSEARTGISSRATTSAKTKSHDPAPVEHRSAGLAKANSELLREMPRRKQAEAELRKSVERQRPFWTPSRTSPGSKTVTDGIWPSTARGADSSA